uniref:Serine/threonine protein kinase n=1 Tax=Panagrellus redivivus TaxID=6233 RepID=A0A7E4V536_PANRE
MASLKSPMSLAHLRARWDDLTSFVSEAPKEKWWKLIVDAHSSRPFYNLEHISDMFEHYDQYKDQLKDRYATAFAVFFKHIDYDVKASDSSEKSAQQLRDFAQETTLDQENYIADLIVQSGSNCTEAHLTKDETGNDDLHFLIDFDSAYLGASPAKYKEYTEAIRKEYAHLSDAEYAEQRLKLLQLFLMIPNIYATKEMRQCFEQQARDNINKEIGSLSGAN